MKQGCVMEDREQHTSPTERIEFETVSKLITDQDVM